MDWTDQELDELATFLAKRMTTELQPLDPSDPPPPGDPSRAWRVRLRQSRDRGQLPTLARTIARVAPDDANLQQACRLLDQRDGGRNTLQVMGVALTIGIGLGVVFAGSLVGASVAAYGLPRLEPVPLQPQSVAIARVEATPTPDPNAHRLILADTATEGFEEADELAILDTAEIEAEPDVPESVWEGGQNPLARCKGGKGEVVGYWYAGTKDPGKKGDRILLNRTVNVRADYPDVHNHFEKRSAVRCVLVEGDMVKLAKPPVKVPGEAYWVPLVAGTVSPKAG